MSWTFILLLILNVVYLICVICFICLVVAAYLITDEGENDKPGDV